MFIGTIAFRKLKKEAQQPNRAHRGDAGFDLFVSRPVLIQPGEWADVHTDIAIQLPSDVWAEIAGRSSTFRRRGIQVQTGIIDSGFRGELFIACWNTTKRPVQINVGERLAQLIPHQLAEMVWVERELLDDTARGEGGFGSTGE